MEKNQISQKDIRVYLENCSYSEKSKKVWDYVIKQAVDDASTRDFFVGLCADMKDAFERVSIYLMSANSNFGVMKKLIQDKRLGKQQPFIIDMLANAVNTINDEPLLLFLKEEVSKYIANPATVLMQKTYLMLSKIRNDYDVVPKISDEIIKKYCMPKWELYDMVSACKKDPTLLDEVFKFLKNYPWETPVAPAYLAYQLRGNSGDEVPKLIARSERIYGNLSDIVVDIANKVPFAMWDLSRGYVDYDVFARLLTIILRKIERGHERKYVDPLIKRFKDMKTDGCGAYVYETLYALMDYADRYNRPKGGVSMGAYDYSDETYRVRMLGIFFEMAGYCDEFGSIDHKKFVSYVLDFYATVVPQNENKPLIVYYYDDEKNEVSLYNELLIRSFFVKDFLNEEDRQKLLKIIPKLVKSDISMVPYNFNLSEHEYDAELMRAAINEAWKTWSAEFKLYQFKDFLKFAEKFGFKPEDFAGKDFDKYQEQIDTENSEETKKDGSIEKVEEFFGI